MAITEKGYAVREGTFSSAHIENFRMGITDTIDCIAQGFLTLYETSCLTLPLEERLEQVAN